MSSHPQRHLSAHRSASGRWAKRAWAFALLIAAAGALGAQEFEAEIRLTPEDTIGREEMALLRIQVRSERASRSVPEATFRLDNFRVIRGPIQSSSLHIHDGTQSTSRTLTWHLRPLAVGKARIHSVTLEVGDKTIELPDRELEVTEETPPERRRQRRRNDPFDRLFEDDPFSEDPFQSLVRSSRDRSSVRAPSPRAPKIFLRAEAEPRDPYVGQQVLYTLRLYTQVDIQSVNPEELPDFKGFWTQVIPQADQLQPEMVDYEGERFGRVVLLQRALFPRRSGSFELEPIRARMDAKMPEAGPFGSSLPRSQEITRSSDAVRLEVRELPEAPVGFQGAVGRMTLAADLKPGEITVGDAATLTLTLSGKGHLQGIPAPQIPEISGLKVFPPQQQSDERLEDREVHGTRSWSFVLVPEHPGSWQLPSIEICYFDPQWERYKTVASPPLDLAVRGTSGPAQVNGESVELHSIRTAALPAGGSGGGFAGVLPWLFVLPWGLIGLVLFLRHRGGGRAHHRPARRRLLERLEQAQAEERPRQAAAEIEDAWRDFLHERWDIPRGSPSTQWGNLLTERGIQAEAAGELVKLADDLHYLRYAPKLSAVAELRRELIERSRKLARSVG
ncbi:MAG: protein BatD [bacterium]|nr:protein BatD [bacterium]